MVIKLIQYLGLVTDLDVRRKPETFNPVSCANLNISQLQPASGLIIAL